MALLEKCELGFYSKHTIQHDLGKAHMPQQSTNRTANQMAVIYPALDRAV